MSRIVALDPGERRVGVAVSDPSELIAQAHETLEVGPGLDDALRNLMNTLDVELCVVGLPVSLDGSEGQAARAARAFAARVEGATGVEVRMHDERFSSVTAERVLLDAGLRRGKRRSARDRVAAAIFLQSFLDGRR